MEMCCRLMPSDNMCFQRWRDVGDEPYIHCPLAEYWLQNTKKMEHAGKVIERIERANCKIQRDILKSPRQSLCWEIAIGGKGKTRRGNTVNNVQRTDQFQATYIYIFFKELAPSLSYWPMNVPWADTTTNYYHRNGQKPLPLQGQTSADDSDFNTYTSNR